MDSKIRIIITIGLTALITACGSGGGSSDNSSTNSQGGPSTPTDPGAPNAVESVTLAWDIPTNRIDGDPLPLAEIGGYEIYYFEESAQNGDGQTIRVTNPDGNRITTQKLPPGTYHFAIASYDTNGVFSEISDNITTTIR